MYQKRRGYKGIRRTCKGGRQVTTYLNELFFGIELLHAAEYGQNPHAALPSDPDTGPFVLGSSHDNGM